ncbi:MAG: hypothetical protein IT158_17675 [Bryobacterales bacterium]|nr:hypothetical protein [Bryobacterales bacterium]
MTTTLLPTTLAGSYAHPGWYCQAREEAVQGRYGPADAAELHQDAVMVAVEDQRRAGIDWIADGELGRLAGVASLCSRLSGLRPLAPLHCLGVAGRTAGPRYEIVGDLAAPHGLGVVEEFRYLASIAGPETKISLPGPLTFSELLAPGGRYRAPLVVAENLALIIRQELLRLAEAGCRHIHLDEPALASHQALPGELVRTVNAAIHGIPVTVGIHFAGNAPAQRSYARLFPLILELEAPEVALEFASREMCEADLWLTFNPGKRLCAGVLDARHSWVETPEEVAGRIRTLLRFVPEDRLTLAPDCGLAGIPRQAAFGKICSLVAAARTVRQEIAGMAQSEG